MKGSSKICTATLLVNSPPEVHSMGTASDYCSSPGAGFISFTWTYYDPDGDSETKFLFQADDDPNFGSPEVNREVNNPSGINNSQMVTVGTEIVFNETYYWRVRVFDEYGLDSGWVSGSSFKTSLHDWPSVVFAPNKSSAPLINNSAIFYFIDLSQCYDVIPTGQNCSDLTETTTTYLWNFGDGATSDIKGSVSHAYHSLGIYNVKLKVTDKDGYYCIADQGVRVKSPSNVPEWKEISPF